MIDVNIALKVAHMSLQLKEKRYGDAGCELICKAPNELLYCRDNNIDYYVCGATDWSQESDRRANMNIGIVPSGPDYGLYKGFYEKSLEINKCIRSHRALLLSKQLMTLHNHFHVVVGGFSQGAAVAQLLARDLNLHAFKINDRAYFAYARAYCIASPRVSATSCIKLKDSCIINDPMDFVRLLPIAGNYMADEYHIKKNKLVRVSFVSKLLATICRKPPRFDGVVHDEAHYVKQLESVIKNGRHN